MASVALCPSLMEVICANLSLPPTIWKAKNWVIEGYGVDPDIVIDNDPYKEFMGEDEQLNKAIEVVIEQLKDYQPLPGKPAYPDKNKTIRPLAKYEKAIMLFKTKTLVPEQSGAGVFRINRSK